jgi:hypothetical protein
VTRQPRPGALLSGKDQEGGDSKRHHPTGQTTLQGRLETSVCPAPSLFLQGFILIKSRFRTVPLPLAWPPRWAPLLLP